MCRNKVRFLIFVTKGAPRDKSPVPKELLWDGLKRNLMEEFGMRNMNSVTGEYGTVLSDRALTILKKHKGDDKSLASVKMFLYDMLEPTAERGDMLYRYEHSLRVAENGALLAEREGLPREELVTACLLHDVGYRECHKDEDFRRHQFISADIAGIYLKNIGYEEEILQEIVKAIVYHNLTDQLPVDITTFQMSVRDCDDIDRFDMIRTAIIIGDCVREKNNTEIMELCRGEINKAKWVMSLQRGTKTAKEMMNAQCMKRISLLEDIVKQAQKGFMAERIEQ